MCTLEPGCGYPPLDQAPFHPSQAYPEYHGPLASQPNAVYDLVRRTLAELGLDRARFGTAEWNPLGELVPPGARIVIKPNWVHDHNMGPGGWECLITHPSILRAVLDYALLARPSDVLMGDSPIQDCDFDRLLALGVLPVLEHVRAQKAPVRLADFRRTTLQADGFSARINENIRPLKEYVTVELGHESLLEPIAEDAARFRVTKYDPRKMKDNHRPGTHRYLIARDLLRADLVVNLPKLKTHKKAGVTACLKNLVGINGNKDYLPHHRKGSARSGHGDCYEKPSLLKSAVEQVLDVKNMHPQRELLCRACGYLAYHLLVLNMKLGGSGEVEGSWHGNDTLWRTCLDLNRVLLYADEQGQLHDEPQRKELNLVDALLAGEGDGPLSPAPRALDLLLAGRDPAACDSVAAMLMGLDPHKIPIIRHAFQIAKHPISELSSFPVACRLNGQEISMRALFQDLGKNFIPPRGWQGYCEANKESAK